MYMYSQYTIIHVHTCNKYNIIMLLPDLLYWSNHIAMGYSAKLLTNDMRIAKDISVGLTVPASLTRA